MVYAPSRSKNGKQHAYLFCSTRLPSRAGDCSFTESIRPELVEDAMQRLYDDGTVSLSTAEVKERNAAIEGLAAVSHAAPEKVRAAKTELVEKLEGERIRLLRLHAEEEGTVSAGAFLTERERMDREITAARKSLAATEQQMNLDAGLLRMALELAENVAEVYRSAEPQLRRALNQAFFKHVWITPVYDDTNGRLHSVEVARVELTEPYKVLAASDFAEQAHAQTALLSQKEQDQKESAPGGDAFLRSVFDLEANGGEGGIRTLERACAPYSLSRRVPSATRPPLRTPQAGIRSARDGL